MINEEKLKEIQAVAIKRGGLCLSTVYRNNISKLLFLCDKGHQWSTVWKNINKGSWCPQCTSINATGKNNKRFDTLNNMQKIALERGGKCLSDEYLGALTKLKWQCNLAHEWMAKPNAIKTGTWCPKCSIGIGERICRLIFETLFHKSFVKVRPDWLKNEISGRNLELDGYCEELKIAFEYNGEQHYSDKTIYTRSKYDLQKIQKCQSKNINLFIIKEITTTIKYQNIIDEIKIQANNFNIQVDLSTAIPINEIYKTNRSELFLNDIKNVAKLHGGKCLSNNYIDNSSKLEFECGDCQFIWLASGSAIKNGTWCPNCANKIKSIDDAVKLAENKNGKCLSDIYVNSVDKMFWECELKHQWKASYNQIQSGGWCPVCFKMTRGHSKKLKIGVYQKIALNKGGECLSTEVNSCYDKLKWKCKEMHIWSARANQIKNTKQWCPECAKIKKRKVK